MGVQLSGQVPAEEYNGLEALHDDLLADIADDVVAVVVLRRVKRVLPDDKDPYPIVKIARVEPVLAEKDEKTVRAVLDRAFKARTGNEALDLPEVDD